jgi:hypothetical protein
MITFEYGAMSSKFSCEAENKLTAYCAMCLQYDRSAHLLVIYSPEECKEDNWCSLDGKISERLDEVFGGEGSFDKYLEENKEAVIACYESIKRVV